MVIIAGLGNPGTQYQKNRHNIGFMALNEIHSAYKFSPWSKKFHADIAQGFINERKAVLLKPTTFMNNSGVAIAEAIHFFKTPSANLFVIHDDLNLPFAKVRIKLGGGAGGHNGIRSIDAHCGKDYHRIRLGIGHPGTKELVHNYVLSNFSTNEEVALNPLFASLAANLPLLIANKISTFMNGLAENHK